MYCSEAAPVDGQEADTDSALKGEALVQVSTGASQDLQQATRMARMAVAECGMSEAIGPVYVERGGGSGAPASSDLQRRVDGEVGRMLREAHARVTALLVWGFGLGFCVRVSFQWTARWGACCARRTRASRPCWCGVWVRVSCQ